MAWVEAWYGRLDPLEGRGMPHAEAVQWTEERTPAPASAHRRMVVRQLPRFALCWLGIAATWHAILVVESLISPRDALLALAGVAAVAFAAVALCRAHPEAPRVIPIVVVASVLLGVAETALFAAVGANGDLLAFVLMTLYLATSIFFGWGWLPALIVQASTAIPWLLATPYLTFYGPRIELVSAIVLGSLLSLGIAEGAARALRAALLHRRNEVESRRALQASRDAYRDLAENARELIFTTDRSGRFTYVNPAFARCFGVTPEELLGRASDGCLSDHPSNAEIRGLLGVPHATSGPPSPCAFEVRTSQATRWLEASPSIIRDGHGQVVGVRAICHDVTERKELEYERDAVLVREQSARVEAEHVRGEAEEAQARAEAATRAKDQFLATLSHELRSPLSSVLHWTHLLRRRLVEGAEADHALEIVERNARAQARLISDLLDVTRIESGKLSVELARVDVGAIVDTVVELVRGAADGKRIAVDVQREAGAVPVRGDATRLQQVVENLLTNAIKFTPDGGRITVLLGRAGGRAELVVRDTGIGIAADVLPHVFERFEQGEPSIGRRHEGLGLGLAIARHLVELHGGTIEAQSDGPRSGAAFTVRLPLDQQPDDEAAPAPPDLASRTPGTTALDRLRVLVVEDEADAREFLTTLLARFGADVVPVSSVQEALVGLEARRPDVLVTDLAMPDEDGFSLIRKVRTMECAGGTRLPAIAVTALASAEERQRAMAAGFDAHFAKPFEPIDVVIAVARAAAAREQPA